MKRTFSSLLLLGGVLLSASCDQQETEAGRPDETSPTKVEAVLQGATGAASSTKSSAINPIRDEVLTSSSWKGKILYPGEEELFEQWADDFSRDANEKRHREQQLAHLVRAEVLDWEIDATELEALPKGKGERLLELPFFGDESLNIVATEIRPYGGESAFIQGHLAGNPEAIVHLSLSNQSPTATVTGPETLYFYESFEDQVILREDEPGSQDADFACDCEYHRSLQ